MDRMLRECQWCPYFPGPPRRSSPAVVRMRSAEGEMDLCELCARSPRFRPLVDCLSSRSMFVLLSSKTSRANKLALAAEHRSRGLFLEWKWKGPVMRSRLSFRFSPSDRFFDAQSYEEDVAPLLKDRMAGPA